MIHFHTAAKLSRHSSRVNGTKNLLVTLLYDKVIRIQDVLTIRLAKGDRRKLEKSAKCRKMTVSEYVRLAIGSEQFIDSFEAARTDLLPKARKAGIYTDDDVFKLMS